MVFSVYPMQVTRNISDAVGKLLCGMTLLLGSFVKEVGEAQMHAQDTNGPSLRRSKRQRPIQIEEPEDEEDSEHEQELDEEEDEWEDIDTEEDEDDEGEEDGQSDGEDGEEEENEVEEERTKKRSYSDAQTNNPNPKRHRSMNSDTIREARHPTSEGKDDGLPGGHSVMHTTDGDSKDDDEADHMPLIKRLRMLNEVIEPVPLESIPPPLAKDRRSRLKLPETSTVHANDPQFSSKSVSDCSHKRSMSAVDACKRETQEVPIARSNHLDFTPPEINLMKFIDEQDPTPPEGEPSKPMPPVGQTPYQTPAARQLSTQNPPPSNAFWLNEPGSVWCLDELTEEDFLEIEENAIQQLKMKKAQDTEAQASELNSSHTGPILRSSEQSVQILNDKGATPVDAAAVAAKGKEPLSANSSVTPAFKPAPTRRLRKAAALKSPYDVNATKKQFHCSKEVCQLYDSILQTHAHPDRSRDLKSEEYVLFSFPLSPHRPYFPNAPILCILTFF
jgi:hypothetical protein